LLKTKIPLPLDKGIYGAESIFLPPFSRRLLWITDANTVSRPSTEAGILAWISRQSSVASRQAIDLYLVTDY
jgi:hypothetical protein